LRVFVPERFRIAHVHWAFPPTTGGVESHLYDLARLQTARGHEVTVVTGEPEPTSTGEYEIVSTPLLKLESIRDAELDRRTPTTCGRRCASCSLDAASTSSTGTTCTTSRPSPRLC
jgi:glycosyltransferase involved in cell wall biosynthesis